MTRLGTLVCTALIGAALAGPAVLRAQGVAAGKIAFAIRCAGCHGANATGGEIDRRLGRPHGGEGERPAEH